MAYWHTIGRREMLIRDGNEIDSFVTVTFTNDGPAPVTIRCDINVKGDTSHPIRTIPLNPGEGAVAVTGNTIYLIGDPSFGTFQIT